MNSRYVFLYHTVCFWRSVPVAASSKSVQDLCRNGIFGVLPTDLPCSLKTGWHFYLQLLTVLSCSFSSRIERSTQVSGFWSTIFPLTCSAVWPPAFAALQKQQFVVLRNLSDHPPRLSSFVRHNSRRFVSRSVSFEVRLLDQGDGHPTVETFLPSIASPSLVVVQHIQILRGLVPPKGLFIGYTPED